MKTERDKMIAGELYDPIDAELVALRNQARDLCWQLNQSKEADAELQRIDIPDDVFAAGNPYRVIKPIES